jgi:cell division protein FtsB
VSGHLAARDTPPPRLRFTPRAGILAVIAMALLLYMAVPLRTYLAQRSRMAQLDRQTQILRGQNTQLQWQVSQLEDPAYLQKIARECLGMVGPGEISFIIVPKSGPAKLPAC